MDENFTFLLLPPQSPPPLNYIKNWIIGSSEGENDLIKLLISSTSDIISGLLAAILIEIKGLGNKINKV